MIVQPVSETHLAIPHAISHTERFSEQANFIRAGVDNAATMAVNALRATGLNDVGLVDNSSTPSQESQDLIVWLFGEFTIAVQSIIGSEFHRALC